VTEAEVALEEARLDAAKRQVAETLETAYRRVRGAAAQLRAYDEEALPAASEAAQLTREAYGFGRGDIFRVLETERALIDVRRARVVAYRELKRSEADLLAAAGEIDSMLSRTVTGPTHRLAPAQGHVVRRQRIERHPIDRDPGVGLDRDGGVAHADRQARRTPSST